MKYKKYILILFLLIFIGLNKVEAADCYYISDGFAAQYDITEHKVYVNKYANKLKDSEHSNKEDILNLENDKKTTGGYTIPAYNNFNKCPQYLILHYDKRFFRKVQIYATDNENIARDTAESIGTKKKHFGFYAPLKVGMTEDEYFNDYADNIFKPSTNGFDGEVTELTCDDLFGDKNDENSLAYLINSVLLYVRIIVPILIILLGSLDFAKAVVAAKEDEMKKAQSTFVKRLIAGVAVFFAPVIVNLIMQLADIVWEGLGYTSCNL